MTARFKAYQLGATLIYSIMIMMLESSENCKGRGSSPMCAHGPHDPGQLSVSVPLISHKPCLQAKIQSHVFMHMGLMILVSCLSFSIFPSPFSIPQAFRANVFTWAS